MSIHLTSSSSPTPEQNLLNNFTRNLDIPVRSHGDATNIFRIMNMILNQKTPSPFLENAKDPVTKQVKILKSMMTYPKNYGITDKSLVPSLQARMQELVAEKMEQLRSAVFQEELRNKRAILKKQIHDCCIKYLTEIPNCRVDLFINTVEKFYQKAVSEGTSSHDSLIFALSKGIIREIIKLPSSEEIMQNETLKTQFANYICPITLELVTSDAVYLRVNEEGHPRERYNRQALEEWLNNTARDPIDASEKTVADIKSDSKAEQTLVTLLYPELMLEVPDYTPPQISLLHNKVYLWAINASYFIVNEEYKRAIIEPQDPHLLVERMEILARETLSRCLFFIEGMSVDEESSLYLDFIDVKEFFTLLKINDSNESLQVLKTYSSRLASLKINHLLKTHLFKIVAKMICNGNPIEEIEQCFTDFIGNLQKENEIQQEFPDCLIGNSDWLLNFGLAYNTHLPEGIIETLRQECPVNRGRKIGETHILALVPSTAKEQNLTLNSLGKMVQDLGHFPSSTNAYHYMSPEVTRIYENTPPASPHWVLMTKGLLPNSRNKNYVEQEALVKAIAEQSRLPYEVPHLLDSAVCLFMHYLTKKVKLFDTNPISYTKCQESVSSNSIAIGNFCRDGLNIRTAPLDDYEIYGMAAMVRYEASI